MKSSIQSIFYNNECLCQELYEKVKGKPKNLKTAYKHEKILGKKIVYKLTSKEEEEPFYHSTIGGNYDLLISCSYIFDNAPIDYIRYLNTERNVSIDIVRELMERQYMESTLSYELTLPVKIISTLTKKEITDSQITQMLKKAYKCLIYNDISKDVTDKEIDWFKTLCSSNGIIMIRLDSLKEWREAIELEKEVEKIN